MVSQLPLKGAQVPLFGHVYCGQTAGWMTPLGTETDLGPAYFVLDGDPSAPRKRHSSPPLFDPCVLPGSPISATADFLFYLDSSPLPMPPFPLPFPIPFQCPTPVAQWPLQIHFGSLGNAVRPPRRRLENTFVYQSKRPC